MTAEPIYHPPRHAPADQLQRMDITFTRSGMLALRAFRAKVAAETGRAVTLGMALDTLILSHPFARASGDSRS